MFCLSPGASCVAGLCGVPDQCNIALLGERRYALCGAAAGLGWLDARAQCQAFGMDLAVLTATVEFEFLRDQSLVSPWVGLTDFDVEGQWRWVVPGGGTNGADASSASWGPGQPSTAIPSYHCGFLLGATAYTDTCVLMRPYVCEELDSIGS